MSDERTRDDEQWRPPGRHAAADSEPLAGDPGAVVESAPGRHAVAEPATASVESADPEVRASDAAGEDEVRPRGRHATREPEPASAVLIEAHDVRKTYRRGPEEVHALDGVSFQLRTGEVVGLVGPSGSGKTTLLNLLCGWEHADSGDVRWPGSGDTPAERRPWIDLAILPQSLGLVEELSVRENIELPIRLRRERANGTSNGKEDAKAEKAAHAARIDDLMDALGLIKFADRGPFEISLGEQQRTALARALVLRPKLLLADEPTGHQDAQWGRGVFGVIREAASQGTCCFIATHNQEAVKFVDRMIGIHDGHLADVDIEAVRAAVD